MMLTFLLAAFVFLAGVLTSFLLAWMQDRRSRRVRVASRPLANRYHGRAL